MIFISKIFFNQWCFCCIMITLCKEGTINDYILCMHYSLFIHISFNSQIEKSIYFYID